MARLIACLEPTPPQMECHHTSIYGAPISRAGRALPTAPLVEIPVSGITVHCIKDTYESALAKMCTGLTRMPVGCHTSFHYIIDAETGRMSSVVPEADLAWAWQSYRSNFPVTTPQDCCQCPEPCPQQPCPAALDCTPETYPGWPVLSGLFPNISADFYTINIGVTQASRPEQTILDNTDCCLGPFGLSKVAYQRLIQLLAWIEYRYAGITVDDQHIAFHDDIVVRDDPTCRECGCGAEGACLICDVSAYCETCVHKIDPTIAEVEGGVAFILVETAAGCKAKISLANLFQQAVLEGLLPTP